ncbi:MAG: DJ-1/PfpI family protein [Pseudomonadota bacterium]
MDQLLRGMRVATLVADGFEQSELTVPREALQREGAAVVIVAPHPGVVQATDRGVAAGRFQVGLTVNELQAEDFDGVLLPGGAASAHELGERPEVRLFLQSLQREGKPVAAIAHGVGVLAAADAVEGRRLAGAPQCRQALRAAGGEWVEGDLAVDENWVSARDLAVPGPFIEQMLLAFVQPPRGWINAAALGGMAERAEGRV